MNVSQVKTIVKVQSSKQLDYSSDGSGSKIFDPGQVGSAIYGLGLNLENFP